MVIVKTAREISKMKDACRISAEALRVAGEAVKPGITTYEIDTIVRKYIEKQGATPSFLGYGGFPASACISVNNVVIHGIPSKKQILKEGDIVSVDVGAFYEGFHGDNAYTFACGKISDEAQRLLDATKEGLFEGIKMAGGRKSCRRYRQRCSEVCRSSQLLGGTRFCRPRRRCEITRRPKYPQLRHTGQRRKTVAGYDNRY